MYHLLFISMCLLSIFTTYLLFLSAHLSIIYLSIYLSIIHQPKIHPSIHLFTYLHIYPPMVIYLAHAYPHPPSHLYIHPCIHYSAMHTPIHSSIHPPLSSHLHTYHSNSQSVKHLSSIHSFSEKYPMAGTLLSQGCPRAWPSG